MENEEHISSNGINQSEQIQRTLLRERFLRLLTALKGQPAEFVLSNNQTVKAKFLCSDVDVLHVQVSDLQTPLGIQKNAVLRTSDFTCVKTQISD